jgi:hypothetical protein
MAMNRQAMAPAIDFQAYLDERVRGFTGREWVLARIDRWLASDGRRFFLLTGEPGSGKTALAGRLFQVSQGRESAGDESTHLKRGFLSAAHFCSARAQSWIAPHAFTESLALQLARYPAFANALAERSGDRQVRIQVRNVVGSARSVTGMVIERLDLSGVAPEDAFVRTVREPLEALLAQDPDLRVCLLVDALDEALLYSGPVGIASLLAQTADLSGRVRFVLTSRPDERIENRFRDAERLSLSDQEFTEQNHDDVHRYVSGRLRRDAGLAPALTGRGAGEVSAVADAVTGRASGNFQYVRFLLDAVADGLRTLDDLDGLPTGLNGLYFDSLERVVSLGTENWATAYAPLMGVLSVAQESLTLAQLQALSGQKDPGFWKHRGDLRQFIEAVASDWGGEQRYRLYHQSFADFLRLPALEVEGRTLGNTFFLPARGWHERIADHYRERYAGYWSECEDHYGLRFVATHLAEAAREGDRLERHERIARLVDVVTDPEFQAAHQQRLDDLPALQRDLELSLARAATDRHPEAVVLLVDAALALTSVRRQYLRPGMLIDLARAGKLEEAERRLALYAPEHDWRQAILLSLAWLAVPADRGAAKAMRDRLVDEGVAPPLDLLVARLDADLSGAAPPVLPALPSPPDLYFVAGILNRIGGGNHVTGIEPLAVEHAEVIGDDADSAPAYLAEQDGLPLVAFAAQDPALHTRYFLDYVAVHAANNYLHYRNRSLWALVAPVLLHPDPEWARQMLVELAQAALAGSRIDFREGLGLALQALHEQAGRPGSGPSFNDRVQRARQAASLLPSPARGEGDPWGHHLRRLAILAEIRAHVLSDPPGAAGLLQQARQLPFGFAGFRTKACLAFAEAASICLPGDHAVIAEALEQARQSAHNIQDYVLCARATSRANAMRLRWWKEPPERLDLAPVVQRFAAEPDAAEFAPVHVVGEPYELRAYTPQRLHIPPRAMEAASLDELSDVYQRPRTLVLQLNQAQGVGGSIPLPPGTPVAIPDPEFVPLLAARLAAEALVSPGLSPRNRVEIIQMLVPWAVANPTALDLVLTRLLLAARPRQGPMLDRLITSMRRGLAAADDPMASGEIPLPPPGVPT